MARVAYVVTTCHEFEGVKVLSSVLKAAGHQTDCFITSEEADFVGAVERWRPDVIGIYATTGQEDWARPHVLEWRREQDFSNDRSFEYNANVFNIGSQRSL